MLRKAGLSLSCVPSPEVNALNPSATLRRNGQDVLAHPATPKHRHLPRHFRWQHACQTTALASCEICGRNNARVMRARVVLTACGLLPVFWSALRETKFASSRTFRLRTVPQRPMAAGRPASPGAAGAGGASPSGRCIREHAINAAGFTKCAIFWKR